MSINSSQKHAELLGVRLTSTSKETLLRKITVDIDNNHKFYIVTPNPEIVMASQKDSDLTTALNGAEVAIPDGIGLAMAHKFISMSAPQHLGLRIPFLLIQGMMVGAAAIVNRKWLEESLPIMKGREVFVEIIQLANKNGWKIFLLGGEASEAADAKQELEKNYKNIKIRTNAGPILDIDGTAKTGTDEAIEKKVIEEINTFSPDFLFVGISHPRQEKWLYRWYKKLTIKGAMTIGGTYKFITGEYAYPPSWVSAIGLDWLWRLLTGSQNLFRIWTAVIQFPFKVFTYKLLH